jgi:hypothetical protein
MQAEAAMPALPAPEAGRRRKQEGAVYTPAFITRYLVEQALGGVLKARFDTLRRQHEAEAAGTARKALADPNAYDLAALNEPQRKALIRFWEAWQEELKRLRILDPACGSGAILIEAFNQLHAVYDLSNARLEELRGQRTLFDLDRQILEHTIHRRWPRNCGCSVRSIKNELSALCREEVQFVFPSRAFATHFQGQFA